MASRLGTEDRGKAGSSEHLVTTAPWSLESLLSHKLDEEEESDKAFITRSKRL